MHKLVFFVLSVSAFGATHIQELAVRNPAGQTIQTGTLSICPVASFEDAQKLVLNKQCATIPIVGGVFNATVSPTVAAQSWYQVIYAAGGKTWSETWLVPDTSTVLRRKDVFVGPGSVVVPPWPMGPPGAAGAPGAASTVPGPTGPPGAAVLNGTVPPSSGTGADGDFFLDTATSCLYGPKASGSWSGACVSLIGPVGATGAGTPGVQGAPGPAGTSLLNGTTVPSSGTGSDGDFYLKTDTSCLYGPKAAGAWGACTSIIGQPGSAGAAGTNGNTLLNGTTAPSSGTGANGDFYLRTDTSCLYGPKTSGAWSGCTSIIGAAGTSGNTLLNGTTAPSSGNGVNGDFFLNTATSCLYGPKAAGAWAGCTLLIGPQGNTGATGSAGQGYTDRGSWNSIATYIAYDVVLYNSSSYAAIATNSAVTPGTDVTKWRVFAGQGQTGSQGPPGSPPAFAQVSPSATPQFSVTAQGLQAFQITLNQSVSSSTFTGLALVAGQDVLLKICENGTGGFTFVPPSGTVGFGSLDTRPLTCNTQTFRYDGTFLVKSAEMVSDNTTARISTAGGGYLMPTAPNTLIGTDTTIPALTLGGAADLTSLSWIVGHDDTLSQPGFTDANGWVLRFNTNAGQQDWDNASKRTFNGLKIHGSHWGAGQRIGLSNQTYCQGVGDCMGTSVLVVGGSQSAQGDEGTLGHRVEMADESAATQRTLNTIPAQTTCGTGATITQAITKATAPQSVTVSSNAGCSVGDHIIVARQHISVTSTEEMVIVTAVTSGHLTAKFSHDHLTGATLSPTTKLDVFDAWPLGQFRWLTRVGHDYTTGTVTTAAATMIGTGTGWTNTVIGGDAILPGFLSLDSDTNTSQAAGLRAWYLICLVTDTTHVTVSDGLGCGGYNGLFVVPTAYKARCGGIIMGTGPQTAPQVVGPYVYLDTPPSVCGWTAGDTVEMTVPVRNGQGGVSVILRSYAQAGIGTGGPFGATNIGDVMKGPAFEATAPPFLYPNPSKPAFQGGLRMSAPVIDGMVLAYGAQNSMLGCTTFIGYPCKISWGASTGSGSMQMYPDTSDGKFWMWPQNGNFQIIKGSNSSVGYQLKMDNVTGNPALQIPDKSGTLLVDADIPVTTFTRTLRATVGDEIHLASIANGQNVSRVFEISISTDDHNAAKRYAFALTGFPSTADAWAKVQPLSSDVTASTIDFDLELLASNPIELRLRKTLGSGTPIATVTTYCYSPNTGTYCTLTSSSTTSSPAAPTVSIPSTVLSQLNGKAYANGEVLMPLTGTAPASGDCANFVVAGGFTKLGGTGLPCAAAPAHSVTLTVNRDSVFSTGPIGSSSEVESSGTIYKVVASGSAAASGSAQTACSMSMDIWKHAGAVPVSSGDKISASAPATLSAAIQSEDIVLTGWTKPVSVDDYFTASVASNSTCLSATVQIWWR